MRIILFTVLSFFAVGLFAAPLGTNYPSAQGKTPAQARVLVVEAAKKYIGVPYVYAGLSNRGLDCSGFIRVSYHDALGIPFASMPASAAGQHSWAEPVNISNAQPGDLVFFKTGATSAVTHVGLYVGDRRFLHAASAGPNTGIIYSNLDEAYYSQRFVSAGRAIPAGSSSSGSNRQRNPGSSGDTDKKELGFFVSVGAAPDWNIFYLNQELIRGFSSHIGIGKKFTSWFSLGLEFRPEYDNALRFQGESGIFRLPITLSWAPNENLRFFGGPVIYFNDPVSSQFNFRESLYNYSYKTEWFGTAGITYTPFVFRFKNNDIAPYLEAAWQRHTSHNTGFNLIPDLMSWTRVSTGLRWRLHL